MTAWAWLSGCEFSGSHAGAKLVALPADQAFESCRDQIERRLTRIQSVECRSQEHIDLAFDGFTSSKQGTHCDHYRWRTEIDSIDLRDRFFLATFIETLTRVQSHGGDSGTGAFTAASRFDSYTHV